MNLNDNMELFENIKKKKSSELGQQLNKNIEKIHNNYENNDIQNDKFKDFNKELVSLYRLHSSKFHSRKIEKSKDISDRFNDEMNLLKNKQKSYENLNIWKEPSLNKKKNNYNNIFEFRKKMAFRFRYMNYTPKIIDIKKDFKLKDDKMNKILKISKSIPNLLLKDSKKNENEGYNDDYLFNKDNIFDRKNRFKEYGFISPFKFNRYIGDLYNYYRSNSYLNENNLIFNNKINDNNIKEKMNNRKDNRSKDNDSLKSNNKNKEKNKRKKIIKLNYLLL